MGGEELGSHLVEIRYLCDITNYVSSIAMH